MSVNGILLLDKPQGGTSHDAVAMARRALRTRAIGHSGTLDPLATGLLVLCIGSATRLSEYLLGQDKRYIATIKLGERTNTDDSDGEIVQQRPVPLIASTQLEQLQHQFSGPISQVPPQFSAIKRNGQRAYALARQGEHVELDARQVTITHLTLIQTAADTLQMEVSCTSGTYIRSLARDIGECLGCGGHLTALRRTHIGAFSVDDAVDVAHISADRLLPPDQAVPHFANVQLTLATSPRFLQGQAVLAENKTSPQQAGLCRVYDAASVFLGIGQWLPDNGGTVKPVKVLVSE
ncbi:MAG: tRNA pseudouridine(55) synthase TruB [Anaerolineae bacterium]|nr:tRNA pseudouridine(55) synthase TruB [Anaerolineae bacterium]